MTGSQDKPTKAKLISELESIRDSLEESAAQLVEPSPLQQKPFTTKQASTLDNKPTSINQHDLLAHDDEPFTLSSEPPILRTPIPRSKPLDSSEPSKMEPSEPLAPLPGQQSLFDHMDHGDDQDEEILIDDEPRSPKVSTPPAFSKTVINETTGAQQAKEENPFLPKHIRERLDKEKQSLKKLQSQANEGLSSVSATPSASLEEQKIVDDLVAKYLPQIEKELREKLLKQVQSGSLGQISTKD